MDRAVAPYAAMFAAGAFLEAAANDAYQLGTGAFTIEAWVRAATAGGAGTIVARKPSGGGRNRGGFLLVVRPDGSIKLATDSGWGYWELITAPTPVNDGTWHHLAAVRDGAGFAVHLDALPAGAGGGGSERGPLNVNNGEPLTIGTTYQDGEPHRPFTGQVGAVTIWAGVRSRDQVLADMRSNERGDAGLRGFWGFDARDGRDSSPYGNTAQPRGAVAYAEPGAPYLGGDHAARLGTSGSLSASSNGAYNVGTGDFTVEAWARTSAAGTGGTIVARKAASGGTRNGGFLLVLRPDGAIKLATDHGFGYFEGITTPTPASDGRWHHFAAVRSGAAIQVYLDGVGVETRLGGSAKPPLNVDNDRPLTIGVTEQEGEPHRHLDGDVAAVTIWSGARGPAQIEADMHGVLRGDEAGLLAYWVLGFANGLDLAARTRNDASPSGVTWFSPGAPIGWFAAALDRQGSLAAASNAAYELGTGDFTTEAWIKTAQPGGSGTVIARKGSVGGNRRGGFLLVLRPDGSLKLATDHGFGYWETISGPTTAADGAWHFVAGVRRGAQLVILLDGQELQSSSSGDASPPLNVNSDEPLTIGTTSQEQEPYRWFTGQLDSVALWSAARSTAEVAGDMNSRLTGREPGLVGLWTFDFRDGRDGSPVNNTAQPSGNVTFPPPGAPIGRVITGAPAIAHAEYDGQTLSASWSAVAQPPVTGYRLTVFDEQGQPVGSHDVSGTEGSVGVALTAAAYTARARALGIDQEGPWSEPVPVVPVPPADVAVVVDGDLAVSWGAATAAASYRAALLLDGEPVESADTARTSAQLARPTDAGAYTVRVRGLAGPGDLSVGPWSPPLPVILAAPVITSVAFDGTTLALAWQGVAGATGYLAGVFEDQHEVATGSSSGMTADITVTLREDGAYEARVRALADRSTGPWGNAVVVIAARPGAVLAGTRDGRVAASWAAVPVAAEYEAVLAIDGAWGAPTVTSAPSIAFEEELTTGRAYLVRVRGVLNFVSGPWSPDVEGPFLRAGTVTYDGAGRLVHLAQPGVANTTYTYDAAGNITSVAVEAP